MVAAEPIVYVVDDDEKVRDALCALLRAKGYTPRAYCSADEFLAEFVPGGVGCLVTDLRMVGTSGVELQLRLRELNAKLPVIVVTGHADVATAVLLMERGAVTLIQKPFARGEVLDAIARALEVNARQLRRDQQARSFQQRLATLTEDERDVMELMVAGEPNKTIVQRLSISRRTCDRRRRSVLDKMDVDSVPALAALLAKFTDCCEDVAEEVG